MWEYTGRKMSEEPKPGIFLRIYPRNSKCIQNTKTIINVHSNIVHNSHKLKTIWLFINWRMDKQKAAYQYNGMLFNHIKDEVLIHATIWMNLENTIWPRRRQTQKATYSTIPILIQNAQNNQIHRDKKQTGGTHSWGLGRNGE